MADKTPTSDAEILKAILALRAEGWSALVATYAPVVRAVARTVFECYREPVGGADLDEVTTEVFQRLAGSDFQWLRSLDNPKLLAPSIRALAAWRALGLLRSKYHTFTCSLEAEVQIDGRVLASAILARPPSSRDRAPLLTREEVDRLAADFTASLGERQKRVLAFKYHAKRNYREIADAEGIPRASVGQILRHERDRFAAKLAEAAPEACL
jgi:DNA-directed RNA polymerase specialized sigma24 family protein